MKKIIASALVIILAFSAKAGAQTVGCSSNELSISYGRASIPGIAMTLGSVLGTAFSFGLAKPDQIGSSGALGIEYFHYFNNGRFAVGGLASAEDFRISWMQSNGKDENGETIYEPGPIQHSCFIALMPGVKYRWVSREHFGMYSKACGGGCVVPGSDGASFSWAIQITPIGMEAGNQRVRGFLDLGFGFQGLIMTGVRVTL